MAGAESNKYKADKTKISMKKNETPPNLLKNFAPEKPNHETHISNPEQQDLNLILSLGRNYSENSKEKGIARASSVSGFEKAALPECFLSLSRCSSLPAEMIEQEQRKKVVPVKELQSMKTMEVKKRLMEKQRISFRPDEKSPAVAAVAPPLSSPDDVAAWAAAAAAKNPALCRAIFKIKASEYLPEKGKIEGQGGLASTSPPPIRSHSLRTQTNIEPVVTSLTSDTIANENLFKPAETKTKNPSKKCIVSSIDMQENGMDVMRRMPSVSTTGDGPNGRKIEGFLYTYMRGQVSIVCVCHGSFLTPAEFVKHAGGKDVANPMKHINVCTAFFSS